MGINSYSTESSISLQPKKSGKLETKYYKLERLCKWQYIDSVNEMLMSNVSVKSVAKWCYEHGFTISTEKMYEYKRLLKEALSKQITVERILGISNRRRDSIVLQSLGVSDAKNLVRNEIEVLDAMIQKGFNSLQVSPDVKAGDVLRAIEMKNKLTQGSHGGLTNYGLDQLRELEKAKFDVLIGVVTKYLPDEAIESLQDELAEAERLFYQENAPELLEEYDDLVNDELAEMNSDDADPIVSDDECTIID